MKKRLKNVVLDRRLISDQEICIDSQRTFMIIMKDNKIFNPKN